MSPDFSDLPIYPAKDLERKANELLLENLGPDPSVPIDVELILERMDGVFFDYWPALRENHQLDGMVCNDVKTHELWGHENGTQLFVALRQVDSRSATEVFQEPLFARPAGRSPCTKLAAAS